MSKIIKAVFTGRFCTCKRVFQWDTDDKLQFVNLDLPNNYTVDFANSLTGDSVPVLATSDTVQIPPEMFVPGSETYAWVWISDTNGGHTRCQATIPIDPRAQRSGASPTPTQASAWDQAVQTLNDATSHAPTIQNGYWYIWNPNTGEYENTDVKAAGTDGENGNIIWWTTDHVTASGDNAGIQRRKLHGPEGLTPAVGDYVFAPAAGNEGELTTLYVIISSSATVIMTALGRIVGPAGQDGYSPDVTITEITGGHRVTITDEDHPDGQSFDVMDGQGGSGSSDYDDLSNKPQVNNVTLSGNKSLSDLGIQPEDFIVTVTYNSGNDSYSADKTFAQIKTAKQAGKNVILKYGDPTEFYRLAVWVSDPLEFAVFSFNQGTAINQIMIDETNLVSRTVGSAGTYSKPSGGIPKTDLASAVQTSLGKADTALQHHQSLAAYRTSAEQDTIDAGKADRVTEVTISTAGAVSQALDAGKIYHFTGAVSSLSLSLNSPSSGQLAQYHFDFESGSTPATVTLAGVTWPDGSFSPEASKRYEVDILNGYGVYLSW